MTEYPVYGRINGPSSSSASVRSGAARCRSNGISKFGTDKLVVIELRPGGA
ncbi:MAG: hypothetical protein R3D85_16530 [Paracoccaceae bacterium]